MVDRQRVRLIGGSPQEKLAKQDYITIMVSLLIFGGWYSLFIGGVRHIGGYPLEGVTLFLIVLGVGMAFGGLFIWILFGEDGLHHRRKSQPPKARETNG